MRAHQFTEHHVLQWFCVANNLEVNLGVGVARRTDFLSITRSRYGQAPWNAHIVGPCGVAVTRQNTTEFHVYHKCGCPQNDGMACGESNNTGAITEICVF